MAEHVVDNKLFVNSKQSLSPQTGLYRQPSELQWDVGIIFDVTTVEPRYLELSRETKNSSR